MTIVNSLLLWYFGAPVVMLIDISCKSGPVALTQLLIKFRSSTNAKKLIFFFKYTFLFEGWSIESFFDSEL